MICHSERSEETMPLAGKHKMRKSFDGKKRRLRRARLEPTRVSRLFAVGFVSNTELQEEEP
jgi:hypothetical protein